MIVQFPSTPKKANFAILYDFIVQTDSSAVNNSLDINVVCDYYNILYDIFNTTLPFFHVNTSKQKYRLSYTFEIIRNLNYKSKLHKKLKYFNSEQLRLNRILKTGIKHITPKLKKI